MIGGAVSSTVSSAVGLGRCVSLVASPVRRAVVQCILPVGRVRVAYTWMRVSDTGFVFGFRDLLWVSALGLQG